MVVDPDKSRRAQYIKGFKDGYPLGAQETRYELYPDEIDPPRAEPDDDYMAGFAAGFAKGFETAGGYEPI